MRRATRQAPAVCSFVGNVRAGAESAIAGFLLASAALHALCFYLFQVVYPPAISLLPPPAQVSVIAPTSDDARAFLNWLDAEDPALASQTRAARGRARLSIAEACSRSFLSCRPAEAESNCRPGGCRTPRLLPCRRRPFRSRVRAHPAPLTARADYPDFFGRTGWAARHPSGVEIPSLPASATLRKARVSASRSIR